MPHGDMYIEMSLIGNPTTTSPHGGMIMDGHVKWKWEMGTLFMLSGTYMGTWP